MRQAGIAEFVVPIMSVLNFGRKLQRRHLASETAEQLLTNTIHMIIIEVAAMVVVVVVTYILRNYKYKIFI